MRNNKSIETYWMAFYMNGNNVIYFDSFDVKDISKEIKKFIENKNTITNTYRIQVCNSIMCGYFCIEFIDFLLKGKSCLIIQMHNQARKMIR